MFSLTTSDIFDYAVLCISGVAAIFCAGTALFAIPWTQVVRTSKATQEFNVYWKIRSLLAATAAAWLVSQLLRLSLFWSPSSPFVPPREQRWNSDGKLCRIYLSVSLGLLQPFFLITALLLCSSTLRKQPPDAGSLPNLWLAALALAGSLPSLLLQIAASWVSALQPQWAWEERRGSLLHYFFAPYVYGDERECGGEPGQAGCILCVYPAASSIAAVVFAVVYSALLWRTAQRMAAVVINRRLRFRLHFLEVVLLSGLAAAEAARSVTILGRPRGWAFEAPWLAYSLCIALLAGAVCWLLVARPVWDALRADKGAAAWREQYSGEDELPQVVVTVKHESPVKALKEVVAVPPDDDPATLSAEPPRETKPGGGGGMGGGLGSTVAALRLAEEAGNKSPP